MGILNTRDVLVEITMVICSPFRWSRFGMQEIFANFVSGIILLFERPIRVGDTVTINGVTGTVAKIRIRAITMIDPDRKEVIVPNKSFVTGQVINWALSNTVTRLVVSVGVAYGSDLDLVKRLLLQAAHEQPSVLKIQNQEHYS